MKTGTTLNEISRAEFVLFLAAEGSMNDKITLHRGSLIRLCAAPDGRQVSGVTIAVSAGETVVPASDVTRGLAPTMFRTSPDWQNPPAPKKKLGRPKGSTNKAPREKKRLGPPPGTPMPDFAKIRLKQFRERATIVKEMHGCTQKEANARVKAEFRADKAARARAIERAISEDTSATAEPSSTPEPQRVSPIAHLLASARR